MVALPIRCHQSRRSMFYQWLPFQSSVIKISDRHFANGCPSNPPLPIRHSCCCHISEQPHSECQKEEMEGSGFLFSPLVRRANLSVTIDTCELCLERRKRIRLNLVKAMKRRQSCDGGMREAALRDLFFSRFEALDEPTFLAMFRCKQKTFGFLRNVLGPYLEPKVHPNNMHARQLSNRRVLTVEEKMCIALRVAGGATYQDAAWGFGVHRTAPPKCFFQFLFAFVRTNLGHVFMPTNVPELQKLADDYDKMGVKSVCFHGCTLTIDGHAVRIKMPTKKDCPNPIACVNRKGFCSINLQAGADAQLKF
jgi:hypothetical protein